MLAEPGGRRGGGGQRVGGITEMCMNVRKCGERALVPSHFGGVQQCLFTFRAPFGWTTPPYSSLINSLNILTITRPPPPQASNNILAKRYTENEKRSLRIKRRKLVLWDLRNALQGIGKAKVLRFTRNASFRSGGWVQSEFRQCKDSTNGWVPGRLPLPDSAVLVCFAKIHTSRCTNSHRALLEN